jgi:nucleotide-binding universal stress UspA family protein
MASIEAGAVAPSGLILFAYDGSELAARAIEVAGRELATGREALVVCVYQPADVGFVVPEDHHIDADEASQVKSAAEAVAARGATLAEQAGFRAQGIAVWAVPTWKGVVETADQRNASLIVVGAHRRSGIVGHLVHNVSAAVLSHATTCSVLVVHERSDDR